MFQRILVPLDGSSRAEQALPVAARIARATGASIVLLQVIPLPNEFVAYVTLEPIPMPLTTNTALHKVGTYLQQVAESKSLSGISMTYQVMVGSAAATILSIVDEQAIDLIVLCSHGYSGIRRWALGSVAEKVTHHSPVPVLLLRDGGGMVVESPQHEGAVRALVTLDGSVYSSSAILPAARLIAALSSPAQGILHLTQVVTPLDASGIGWKEKEILIREAKENLSAIVASTQEELVVHPLALLKFPITWSVTFDKDVASGIIKVAENGEDVEGVGVFGGCDLIAMATHGRGALQRWLMGSVTERVLHATKLPLLIVRPSTITKYAPVEQLDSIT